MRLPLLLLWLLLAIAGAAQAEPAAMHAVRLAPGEVLALDGSLDHPAWQRAPVYADFTEKDPQYGAVPPQSTRVQVLFDDRALYVGVTALDDRPDLIRDPLVRRDLVLRTQDFVVVYIDAIGSRRSAQFFRINAAGSIGDGMHTAADDSEDFAPDFDWDGAVQRNAAGWTAVLRLPLSSLRFAEGPDTPWRIMVARRLPREQFHLITSVPVPRDAPSFIATMQPLEGVTLPAQHNFLTLRPSLTLRRADAGAGGNGVDASLDLKWRARADLVVDATLNPDFSQVALDVPQLRGNERFALFLTEKRPFFFESSDLLRSPTDALYTRSLTQPRWGLRGTWRGASMAGTAFAIDDQGGGQVLLPGPYGTGAAEQPASTVLAARLRADRPGLQGGLVVSARHYGGDRGDNQVVGPDLNWQLDQAWQLRAQWLHARTSALDDGTRQLVRGAAVDADRVYLRAAYNRDDVEANIALDDIGTGFRNDSGFVGQAGVRRLTGWLARGWREVGPLNEFWVNTDLVQTVDHGSGRVIEQAVRPGLWMTGARNLEAWLEWHVLSKQRLAAGDPLLDEHYVHAGFLMTPTRWLHVTEASFSAGRMVDAGLERVRDGRRADLSLQLRPLPRLELEPSLSLARLSGQGKPAYRESASQLLAVWHLGANSQLRAILQRRTLERGAAADPTSRVASLTWSLRRSAGTVLYVGASRSDDASTRLHEAFVKLQFDVDEVRAWF